MHQRQLGPFTISALGLGCMNICMGYGDPVDDETAGTLLNTALDAGYTFLDTASMYGNSERLIGKHIAGRRHEYTLASKCGIFKNNEGVTETSGRPEILRKTCEDSLSRLNTEVIDLYYLHRIDPNVPVEDSVG
ncbi:MAG: aryl-alcohol dehydrogenase-like predicted oxidoreductase, partial [Parvicella sp.]